MQIDIQSNAASVLRGIQSLPPRIALAIAATLDLQNQLSIGHAQRTYLSGPRPQRLGVVTNRLRSSLTASKAIVSGNTVSSAIGTNVVYAGVHERGFSGTVTVRSYIRRAALRQVAGAARRTFNLQTGSISAPTPSSPSGPITVRSHQRKMNVPARPFLAPTLEDRKGDYSAAVSAAVLAAWQEGSA